MTTVLLGPLQGWRGAPKGKRRAGTPLRAVATTLLRRRGCGNLSVGLATERERGCRRGSVAPKARMRYVLAPTWVAAPARFGSTGRRRAFPRPEPTDSVCLQV